MRARVHLEAGECLDVGRLVAERRALVFVGPAAALSAHNAWYPAWSLGVQGWWLPRDGAGLRPALGLRTGLGLGEVEVLGRFPTGRVLASLGWWAGRRFQVGPDLGAGLAWRRPEGSWQAAPLLAPSVHLQWRDENTFVALEPTLDLFPAEGALTAVPEVLLTVGLAL